MDIVFLNETTVTIVDPNTSSDAFISIRMGSGVLAQPDFINRGTGYRTSTSDITITGDGYADIIPELTTLTIAGVRALPGPGVQIRITDVLDLSTEADETDLKVFSGVSVTDLGDDGSGAGTRLVRFTMSPSLEVDYNLSHGTQATLRERFSQCRITGHDFLDIGTGNFVETNYPSIMREETSLLHLQKTKFTKQTAAAYSIQVQTKMVTLEQVNCLVYNNQLVLLLLVRNSLT